MSNLQNFRPNYFFEWSRTVPHVAQADVLGNGEGIAIAVVAIDANNQDLHYIRLDRLDEIDLRNLAKILQSRDAGRWPLWDLLSQRHLPNGMNALNFFNQLVWTRTISGQNAPFNKGSNATVPLHTIFGLGMRQSHLFPFTAVEFCVFGFRKVSYPQLPFAVEIVFFAFGCLSVDDRQCSQQKYEKK